jgi:hypothetical protein
MLLSYVGTWSCPCVRVSQTGLFFIVRIGAVLAFAQCAQLCPCIHKQGASNELLFREQDVRPHFDRIQTAYGGYLL